MVIIGILGRSRVGKDTAATIFSKIFEYPIVRLSSPVKMACGELFGISQSALESNAKDSIDVRYGKTPRDLLVWMTTKVQREFPSEFFVNRLFDAVPEHTRGIIVPDIRYDHDISLLKRRGAVLLKVTRKDAPIRHTHEDSIDGFDGIMLLENNGSLAEFEKQVYDSVPILHETISRREAGGM